MLLLFLAKSTESKRFFATLSRYLYFPKSEVRSVLNDKCYSSFQWFFRYHDFPIINLVFSISFHDFYLTQSKNRATLNFPKKLTLAVKNIPLRRGLPTLEHFKPNLSNSSNLTVQMAKSAQDGPFYITL